MGCDKYGHVGKRVGWSVSVGGGRISLRVRFRVMRVTHLFEDLGLGRGGLVIGEASMGSSKGDRLMLG